MEWQPWLCFKSVFVLFLFPQYFWIETIWNYSQCLNNHIIPCLSPNKVENSLLQKCFSYCCFFQEYFHNKRYRTTKKILCLIWFFYNSNCANLFALLLTWAISFLAQFQSVTLFCCTACNSSNSCILGKYISKLYEISWPRFLFRIQKYPYP